MGVITARDIPAFQLLQWKYAIKIQHDTGLGYSKGSVPKYVAEKFGMPYRKGKLAKTDMLALIAECDARLLEHDHATGRHIMHPHCRMCIDLGYMDCSHHQEVTQEELVSGWVCPDCGASIE